MIKEDAKIKERKKIKIFYYAKILYPEQNL